MQIVYYLFPVYIKMLIHHLTLRLRGLAAPRYSIWPSTWMALDAAIAGYRAIDRQPSQHVQS